MKKVPHCMSHTLFLPSLRDPLLTYAALDILSQIFGAFMASLTVMGMYRQQILAYEKELIAAGLPLVSATGPAGIFCSFPVEGQSLGYLFL